MEIFFCDIKAIPFMMKNIGTDPKLITEGRAKNYTVARGKQKQMSLLV